MLRGVEVPDAFRKRVFTLICETEFSRTKYCSASGSSGWSFAEICIPAFGERGAKKIDSLKLGVKVNL